MAIDKTAILITGAAGGLGKAFVEMAKTLPGVDLVLIRSGAINTDLVKKMNTLSTSDEKSNYEKHLKKFIGMAQKNVGRMVEPATVAKLVKKAITASGPRKIYQINRNRTILIMSSLPQRWIDYLIRKMAK